MKTPWFILLLVVFSSSLGGQSLLEVKLSEKAEITVITADPGKELYASFGHTAFRVKDPVLEIDRIYNYGTFSFRQPNFYLKFMRGQLDYLLTGYPFSYFLGEYERENRGVREMVLNLVPHEKQNLFQFLEWNRLPANATYRYDFFFDNCATRVRDAVVKILGPMEFPATAPVGQTFRQAVQKYTSPAPWSGWGIDLILGTPTDKLLDSWTGMFLPHYLEKAFLGAKFQGTDRSLVGEYRVLNSHRPEEPPVLLPWSPVFWFGLILAGVGFLSFFYRKKRPLVLKIWDQVFFFLTGFLGLVIFLLWFFTEHSTTKVNLNILWLWPTHLVLCWFVWTKTPGAFIKIYWRGTWFTALIGLGLILGGVQGWDPGFFPFLGLLLLRTWFQGDMGPWLRSWVPGLKK